MRRQVATANFLRTYDKFICKHPDLVERIEELMDGLAADARTVSSYRLHENLAGFRDAVVFIGIGSHDDVY